MNVFSAFDGISCGRIALQRAGIHVDKYYASEIDKYAIKVANNNHPTNINVGDINNVDTHTLDSIDLLIGGSPCQGFSRAGDMKGFDDHRSRLFWKYVELLNVLKPKYFILENVYMKKEWQDIISNALCVGPIRINSSLVSAQKRDRLYWTNIPNITQPTDKNIRFGDIRQYDIDSKHVFSDAYVAWLEKQSLVTDKHFKIVDDDDLVPTVTARYKQGYSRDIYFGVVDRHYFSDAAYEYCKRIQQRYNIKLNIYRQDTKTRCLESSMSRGYSKQRFYSVPDFKGLRWLTPIECERLQTLPDNYTEGVSNTQRYKMLGNGWTVDVIAHIFSFLPKEI